MNQFAFTSVWSAELSANYNGRMAYGQATVHPALEVNVGIQKKMFRNRCTVTLFAKDVFNANYQKVDIQSPGVQAFVDERHNKRVLGIAFAWRFKRQRDKRKQKEKEIDETKE